MENPNPQDHSQAIKEALFAGQKINAIKLYREQTHAGLAESKAAVEKLETELRVASPERFTRPQAGGCFSAILVIGLLGAALWKALA